MFSVNIDKLIDVSSDELKTYDELAENVLDELKQEKTFSVITGGLGAFKLAYVIHNKGKRVLFIDADISSKIFVGKYKLGKNIPGVIDFLKDVDKARGLVCHTNKKKFDIIFTGNVDGVKLTFENEMIMKGLLDTFSKEYDIIIVDSDKSGMAAKFCASSVLMVDEELCNDEEKIDNMINELEKKGCNVKGVVINERDKQIY